MSCATIAFAGWMIAAPVQMFDAMRVDAAVETVRDLSAIAFGDVPLAWHHLEAGRK
jgi:hypothetical protein